MYYKIHLLHVKVSIVFSIFLVLYTTIVSLQNTYAPWLVWLSGLRATLGIQPSPVRFPV